MRLNVHIIILTFIFIAFLGKSWGQYMPLLTTDHHWIQWTAGCDTEQAYRIDIDRDTVVNDVAYQILMSRHCEFDRVFGLVRSNETNSKLWFRDIHRDEEILIMDLDLSVGDRFNDRATVVEVTQVNGRKRITLDSVYVGDCILGPGTEPLRFIEGVGPNSGLSISLFDFFLDCATDRTGLAYQGQYTDWWPLNDCSAACIPLTTNTEELPAATEKIQLLFTSDYLQLATESNDAFHLLIYDLTGRYIARYTMQRSEQVNLSGLNPAAYIAVLLDKKGRRILSEQFIVSNG